MFPKIVLISIHILLFVTSSFSQDFSLKFYGGGNFYYSEGSQILDSGEEIVFDLENGKIGYFVGYGIKINMKNNFVFNSGIEVAQRNESKGSWEGVLKNPYRYHYLSLSPSIGYELFGTIGIHLGFQVDYLLHKQKISYVHFINEESAFSNYDAGPTLGLSGRIYQFEIFGSYYHGLPYIVNLEGGRVENHDFSETTKSRMFKFGVGYLID